MSIQARKDLVDLRSAFNEFDRAFGDWIESQSLEGYNRSKDMFIQISNDFEHIKLEYEEETIKIAENIVVKYFSGILKSMPDAAINGILNLWTHCSKEIDGNIITPLVAALRLLPAEKHQALKKWEPILLAPLKEGQ